MSSLKVRIDGSSSTHLGSNHGKSNPSCKFNTIDSKRHFNDGYFSKLASLKSEKLDFNENSDGKLQKSLLNSSSSRPPHTSEVFVTNGYRVNADRLVPASEIYNSTGITVPRSALSLNAINRNPQNDPLLEREAISATKSLKNSRLCNGRNLGSSYFSIPRSFDRSNLEGSTFRKGFDSGFNNPLDDQCRAVNYKLNPFCSVRNLNFNDDNPSGSRIADAHVPSEVASKVDFTGTTNASGSNRLGVLDVNHQTNSSQATLRDKIVALDDPSTLTPQDLSYLRKMRQKNNLSMTFNNFGLLPSLSQSLKRAQSQKSIHLIPSSMATGEIGQLRSSTNRIEPQRIYVVRHGERVDSTFGINWLDIAFDNNGKYRRININLPRVIPCRRNPKDFLFDPPLTEVGLVHSHLIGEELDACGIIIQHCYSSPALRCIQTASKILEGMNKRDIPIRIEPCLFEFLKWHPSMPLKSPFMDGEELSNNGFHIDTQYKTVYPLTSLRKDEDEGMYYTRSHTVMQQIIRNHENDQKQYNRVRGSLQNVNNTIRLQPFTKDHDTDAKESPQCKPQNILVVAHAPTLEVASRQLTGGNPRVADLKYLVRQVPYLSIQTIERQTDNTWKLKRPPIPPMKHSAVEPYDWRYMR